MGDVFPKNIDGGFESIGHYEESMRDFTRVLDYLDRTENISEERKELYHHHLDEIGMDGVFELARNTNELFKELGINSYRLQLIEQGRITYEQGIGIHAQTPEERIELARKIYELGIGIHAQTPEERIELARKGLEAQGKHVWSLEEIANIGELKYEQGLTWNDTASKMNEKYDKDWTTNQVILAYQRNKHLLDDEEE